MEPLLEEEGSGSSIVDRAYFTDRICGADRARVAGYGTRDSAVIASLQRVVAILWSIEMGAQ